MNAYIVVEGFRTEMMVFPKWLEILAPRMTRIFDVSEFCDFNYYLFSAGGIPSIYRHVANAAEEINDINAKTEHKIDFLIVCIDTEEESRDFILQRINDTLKERGVSDLSFQLLVFEQKTCIETWFLGNRRIFKNNPDDEILRRYVAHYNVKTDDPELMPNIDSEVFTTTAQFHHSYLKKIFAEQHISYSKCNPGDVCKPFYLERIIERHSATGHIPSFGRWYEFVKSHLS